MSPRITVVCPSRGRPEQARMVFDSFMDTRSSDAVRLHFALDNDDKTAEKYPPTWGRYPSHSPVEALNCAMLKVETEFISFISDDNRFVTDSWDTAVLSALDEMGGGVVYTNDLIVPGSLPTVVFMSTAICRAVGYFALPSLQVNYFDNVWKDLGAGLGKLRYLNDVAIQHLSLPHVFSSEEKHIAHEERILEDRVQYFKWVKRQLPLDIQKSRVALGIEEAA